MNVQPFAFFGKSRELAVIAGVLAALIALAAQDAAAGSLRAAAQNASRANIIGWWPLDGDATDAARRGLNGAVLGGAAFDAEKPASVTGQSIRFSAEADGIQVPANATLNADQFTLGYFINLKGATQGNAGLERLSSRTGDTFETAAGDAHAVGGTSSSTGVTLSYYSPSISWNVTDVELPVDGWVHVAWHNTADAMELFLNGELVYSGLAVPPATLNGLLSFGTRFSQVEGFEGLMDDAFLADGALTAADIAGISAQGVGAYFGFTQDSDNDGLPDWWEVENELNPNDNGSTNAVNGPAGDPDNDGLTNSQEYARGTKARDADSDDDGLGDGAEVTGGSNPMLADTDGDGLADGDEITRGTDPLRADTDGDSISDGAEVALGTNPLDPLSGPPASSFLVLHLDFDGDTQDNSPLLNHGELLGTPEFVNDTPLSSGQALSFSSNEMGVTIAENDSLGANQFTLCYWAKPTTLQEGAGVERLTSRAADSFETAIGDAAAIGGAADLNLSYYQGTWNRTGVSLTLNEWAHVAWRSRGAGPQNLDLLVNGVVVFTGVGVPATRPGNGLMNIGTRHNGSEGFEGLMDDVRLYRAPLRDADIAAIAGSLIITQVSRSADGASVTLSSTSQPNRTYSVERTTDLGAAVWDKLTVTLTSGGATTTYVDTTAANLPLAYYRVRVVTP